MFSCNKPYCQRTKQSLDSREIIPVQKTENVNYPTAYVGLIEMSSKVQHDNNTLRSGAVFPEQGKLPFVENADWAWASNALCCPFCCINDGSVWPWEILKCHIVFLIGKKILSALKHWAEMGVIMMCIPCCCFNWVFFTENANPSEYGLPQHSGWFSQGGAQMYATPSSFSICLAAPEPVKYSNTLYCCLCSLIWCFQCISESAVHFCQCSVAYHT